MPGMWGEIHGAAEHSAVPHWRTRFNIEESQIKFYPDQNNQIPLQSVTCTESSD